MLPRIVPLDIPWNGTVILVRGDVGGQYVLSASFAVFHKKRCTVTQKKVDVKSRSGVGTGNG